MSLRTKLLAAIVGLNGVILLLALYLMLREEDAHPPPPSPHVISDAFWLGSAFDDDADEVTRVRARERLRRLETERALLDPHVVEEKLQEDPAQPAVYRVWPAATFLASRLHGPTVDPGPLRDTIVEKFKRARQNQNRYVGFEWLAVVLPSPPGPERTSSALSRGIVARYVAAASPRAGIRLAYVVVLLGVIVLTGVSFWLVSHWVVEPLQELTEAADRIATGDYRIRIQRTGTNDEFDRTTYAFNRMAAEIAEYQGHLEDRVLSALGRMRKAEQHLAIAQRLAATGKLASGVAHEINNPLGGMRNAVKALLRGDLPEEKAHEYLDLVSDGLARIEETVKKFLSFTPRRVEPRPTDLASVVVKALALAEHRARQRQIEVETELPEAGEAAVFGDPHELEQVVLNLLLNALDAIPPGQRGHVRIRVTRGPEDVSLSVQDDGIGMTPEEQDRCFDLFVTTKEVGEGTGMGLAVVHNIVTNHGGRVEVESAPGEGATFRVRLPAESDVGSSVPEPEARGG